ncbi:EAL domain-containing protein [Thermolongibacillus altinsuensis]|uniref:EAL domain-containing protein n=1 Tax=Thermolongibacillus altinsuensis TaxID=575256 RepID=UPI00242A2CBE|nr:EAL domain-containing protein [Thermolongibacillus altinsuensis]GMB09288.1 hypothetical protein B1no1_19980 [Thermolongibacillus altinsuensis]
MTLDEIQEIITKNLFTNVFQPIYHLPSKQIVGYESLLRCSLVKSPDLLFNYAQQQGCIHELDMASISNSFKSFYEYYKTVNSSELFLSVNVYPSTIAVPFFPQFLEKLVKKFSLSNQQIVLEVNESEPLKDLKQFIKNIVILKEKGFIIALDDFGRGKHSLYTLLEVEPHIIKLDQYLAKDLSKNLKKQKILSYFLDYFNDSENIIILEGIETEEDMICAKNLGIGYAQGYYLAKPHMLSISVCI